MVHLDMKRERGELESITTMANCLMLLSRGGEFNMTSNSPTRVFECKTCNRQFTSFQALGGHRASHKKPRVMGGDSDQLTRLQEPSAKPKTHECPICGLEFGIGQALGGHMRRHRPSMNEKQNHLSLSTTQGIPVVKKANGRRALSLDLNLTPYENDLKFQVGKVAPMVDCYL